MVQLTRVPESTPPPSCPAEFPVIRQFFAVLLEVPPPSVSEKLPATMQFFKVELDFPDDVGDAGLAGLAGREVAGFLGLAGAGPVRAVAGEGARGEDLEQERGEREIGLLRGKKPRPYRSRRPGHAGS